MDWDRASEPSRDVPDIKRITGGGWRGLEFREGARLSKYRSQGGERAAGPPSIPAGRLPGGAGALRTGGAGPWGRASGGGTGLSPAARAGPPRAALFRRAPALPAPPPVAHRGGGCGGAAAGGPRGRYLAGAGAGAALLGAE